MNHLELAKAAKRVSDLAYAASQGHLSDLRRLDSAVEELRRVIR